jgi:uncharacterized UPF0160 family protein
MNLTNARLVVTHRRRFHADEVFGVAILKLAGLRLTLKRVERNDPLVAKADFALDIGHVYNPDTGRFDHHQPDGAGKRSTGVPYATAGLLWKSFGLAIAGSPEVWAIVDDRVIAHVDAADFGEKLYSGTALTLSTLVAQHNGDNVDDDRDQQRRFLQAVTLCATVLRNALRNARSELQRTSVVARAIQAHLDAGKSVPRVLVLDTLTDWRDRSCKQLLIQYKVDALVMPMGRGNDHVVHLTNKQMAFSPSWMRTPANGFQVITGMPGQVVITTQRHARADSRAGAEALATTFVRLHDTVRVAPTLPNTQVRWQPFGPPAAPEDGARALG